MATDCVRWAFVRAAEMKDVRTKIIRDKLSAEWTHFRHSAPDYIDGHKRIPFIAKRLADLLLDYQVIVPFTRYNLVLSHRALAVTYAIARPWRKDEPWLCVSLRRSKAPQYHRYPDWVSYARWLQFQLREPHRNIELLHVPMLNGEPWAESGMSKSLVSTRLDLILRTMQAEQHYSRSGPHCEDCRIPRCLEATHDR